MDKRTEVRVLLKRHAYHFTMLGKHQEALTETQRELGSAESSTLLGPAYRECIEAQGYEEAIAICDYALRGLTPDDHGWELWSGFRELAVNLNTHAEEGK